MSSLSFSSSVRPSVSSSRSLSLTCLSLVLCCLSAHRRNPRTRAGFSTLSFSSSYIVGSSSRLPFSMLIRPFPSPADPESLSSAALSFYSFFISPPVVQVHATTRMTIAKFTKYQERGGGIKTLPDRDIQKWVPGSHPTQRTCKKTSPRSRGVSLPHPVLRNSRDRSHRANTILPHNPES